MLGHMPLTGLHTQKAYTHTGNSSSQILFILLDFDVTMHCKDVGSFSTCLKYAFYIGTFALIVSQILLYRTADDPKRLKK